MAIFTSSLKLLGGDKVEALRELGVKTTAETILLLGIAIGMIAHVLAHVIEDLGILQHHMGSLCKRQELI
jgi:hypothetical protein